MSIMRDGSATKVVGTIKASPGLLTRAGGMSLQPASSLPVADYRCHQCGSEDIQKLSVVHEMGTTTIDARTSGTSTGLGFARGGLGVGTAFNSSRTTGTQISALAKRAAPPQAQPAVLCVILAIVALMGGPPIFGVGLTIVAVAGFGALAFACGKHNREVHAPRLAAWQQSWLCHRCGSVSRLGS